MSVRTSQRITAVVGPFVAAALVLGACGGGASDAESRPTIELAAGETSFETLAPATTIPVVETEETDAGTGGASATSEEYTVQANDFPIGVADKFDISLSELMELNGWAVCGQTCPEFPGIGGTLRVPAGATASADDPAETDPADTGDTAVEPADEGETGETGEAIPEPEGDSCDPGSYTIAAGDFEGRVADNFDITVDELRAANEQTTDYSVFYVGLEIVIPARDNC